MYLRYILDRPLTTKMQRDPYILLGTEELFHISGQLYCIMQSASISVDAITNRYVLSLLHHGKHIYHDVVN